MQIGGLHIIGNKGYWFAHYCDSCGEKVFVSREEAKEFVERNYNLSERSSLLKKITHKLPKIRLVIEK